MGRAPTPESAGPRPGQHPAALLAVLLIASLLPRVGRAQLPPPPDGEYVTLETEHFRVTFPPDLEELGRRAAARAERAYSWFSEGFFPPPGTIDILVTDHADLTNGYAFTFPSNRITIWAQPPLEGLALSHFDEWLELVVTHEVAHIFHLDYAGPPGRVLRSVFGRVPERWPYFSAQAVPFAAVEGVAVHEELRLHGSGRLQGTVHESLVRAQWLEGLAESVDRGLGSSPVWPGADRRYVYGGLFFRYLAGTRGEESVIRFLRLAGDQWIPFRLDAAAREAFDASFEELWDEWLEEVGREVRRLAGEVAARARPWGPLDLLTEGGAFALYPSADPQGSGVAYVRSDDRNEIQLRLRTDEGDRSLGRWNTLLAPPRWTHDGTLVVPQAEHVDRYRVYRDLYAVASDGAVRRLTRGLRVTHVDPHPTGGGFAAVLGGEGTNRLVRLLPSGELESVLRDAEAGVHWSFPAWAPDGTRLAVVRKRPGGWSALLILGPGGEVLHEVTEERGILASPSWGPDGESLVWSSDRSGVANLYGARFVELRGELRGPLQITDLVTAGSFPSVDRSNGWIYFSTLTGSGWELARVPYRPEGWFAPAPTSPRYLDGGARASAVPLPDPAAEVRPYSALPTLVPRYWLPIHVEGEDSGDVTVLHELWGLRTSGVDLLGRHAFALRAAVPFAGPFDRAEWGARYVWAGLGNPLLIGEAGQSWDFRGRVTVPDDEGGPAHVLFSVSRERFVGGALELTRRRLRLTSFLSVGGRWIAARRHLQEPSGAESQRARFLVPSGSLVESRVSVGFSTARSYPFSVSTEDGVALTVALRERWDRSVPASAAGQEGVDGSLREATAVLRAYRGIPGPGFSDHVVALRVAAGVATGPGAGGGHFALGGSGRLLPTRGHPVGAARVSDAWSASAEWRFPLAVVHRGLGAWPIHLDRLAGAVFWDTSGGRARSASGTGSWGSLSSVGLELVLTYSLLFEEPDRVRLGAALEPDSGSFSAYLASGWSF